MFDSKIYGEMSHSKNIHAEKFSGTSFYIKKSAEKFDIRKSNGNSLMTKTRALKSLPTIKFYGNTPDVKKSDNKIE